MTHLLIQIHLIESKVGRVRVSPDSSNVLYYYYENLMLDEVGVDTTLFYTSLDFYSNEPQVYQKIYAAVVDSLLEMESKEKLLHEAERKKLEERQAAITDSIKVARDSIKNLPKGPTDLERNRRFMPIVDSVKLSPRVNQQ